MPLFPPSFIDDLKSHADIVQVVQDPDDDDAPIKAGSVLDGVVDEDGLSGGLAGDAYATGDVSGEAVVANGDLKISWGADNADKVVNTTPATGALVQDGPGGNGNRSVVFASNTVAQLEGLDLT